MIFRQFIDHDSNSYSYLIADEETSEAAMIDPVQTHTSQYIRLLDELNLVLKFAMDTHTHADHITALGKLRDQTGCLTMMGKESHSECASTTFTKDEKFHLGKIEIQALYTPGHTDDSYSFLLKDQEKLLLFTGDTLLIRGTGRTDFQNGNTEQAYHSLMRLLSFPDNTSIYPAHDYKGWTVSTIGEEKKHNPRLQVKNIDEYKAIMDNLNLPHPRLMDIAVPTNRACGKI